MFKCRKCDGTLSDTEVAYASTHRNDYRCVACRRKYRHEYRKAKALAAVKLPAPKTHILSLKCLWCRHKETYRLEIGESVGKVFCRSCGRRELMKN